MTAVRDLPSLLCQKSKRRLQLTWSNAFASLLSALRSVVQLHPQQLPEDRLRLSPQLPYHLSSHHTAFCDDVRRCAARLLGRVRLWPGSVKGLEHAQDDPERAVGIPGDGSDGRRTESCGEGLVGGQSFAKG
jgi:hypothetical protein